MSKDPAAPGFKQKAKREFIEFLIIAAYLAFFFCALVTYTMLLLRKYEISYLNYSLAIINALVIAKIILIGQMMKIGKGYETRPLYQSVIYKSVVFGLLVFAFHVVEEFVKRLYHGRPFGAVWHETRMDDLIGKSIVIFCAFLPLFAYMELRRVLGEEKLYALLRSPGVTENPATPARS